MVLRPGADCHGPSASSLLHHLCGGPQRHCPASSSNGERAQYPATQTSVVANERYGCCTAPSRAASSFDSPPYEMTTAVSKRDCYTAMGRHSIPVQKLRKANGPDTPTAPPNHHPRTGDIPCSDSEVVPVNSKSPARPSGQRHGPVWCTTPWHHVHCRRTMCAQKRA